MIVVTKYPNANGICYEFEDDNEIVYKLILSVKVRGIKLWVHHPAKLQPKPVLYENLDHFARQSEFYSKIAEQIRSDNR